MAEQGNDDALDAILQHYIGSVHLAVCWRRLLDVAARYPGTLGLKLKALAAASPLLTAHETSTEAGKFLAAVFPLLRPDERPPVERLILELSDVGHDPPSTTTRDRLLGCLRLEDLTTDEAKRLWEALNAGGSFPANEPPFRLDILTKEFGESEFLAEQGVPVDAEPNRRIRELEASVKVFVSAHRNSVPSDSQIASVFPAIKLLHEALQRADRDGVHIAQRDYALNTLAEAPRGGSSRSAVLLHRNRRSLRVGSTA